MINIAINTPLEFGFHSVPYKKAELQQLDVKNKRLIKKIWQISMQSPTSLICGPKDIERMELRRLEHLYREILITDLMELINFTDKNTLYYQIRIQRLQDLKRESIIQWKETKKNKHRASTTMVGSKSSETSRSGKDGDNS